MIFAYAPLAQSVEQLTLNQWVRGSNPRWCTKAKTPVATMSQELLFFDCVNFDGG